MNATDTLTAAIAAAVESLNQQDARPGFADLSVITYQYAALFGGAPKPVLGIRVADSFAYGPGGQTIKAPAAAVQTATALAFEIARGMTDDLDEVDEVADEIDDVMSKLAVGFDYANDDGAILYFPNIPATTAD